MPFSFELKAVDRSGARAGRIQTDHGSIETPIFMPVGTQGTVKALSPDDLEKTGAQIILSNTYHLHLRPGEELIRDAGGIQRFMSWEGPVLTDSGGYQLFSLSKLTKISDDGVEFANHIDGSRRFIDARKAIDIQNRLGADIIMCFDECVALPAEQAALEKAVERTIDWAAICRRVHKNPQQLLFGIVQGGTDAALRQRCAQAIVDMDFDGYAIGGLSVGEGHELMVEAVSVTSPFLPEQKPRYLMGVGMPADIIAAVRLGVDMFDCVIATRNGRNAFAFTDNGPLRLRNSCLIDDNTPIEPDCDCYCCRNFSRASVRHFFNIGEMLGPILASLHNLRFFQRLTAEIREKIEKNQFADWATENTDRYKRLYNTAAI